MIFSGANTLVANWNVREHATADIAATVKSFGTSQNIVDARQKLGRAAIAIAVRPHSLTGQNQEFWQVDSRNYKLSSSKTSRAAAPQPGTYLIQAAFAV